MYFTLATKRYLTHALQITVKIHPWFTQRFVDRPNVARAFANAGSGTYALHGIPLDATWGTTYGAFNSTHNVLCINNRPLNIWVVGDLARIFPLRDNLPPKKLGTAMDAYVKSDLDDFLALIEHWSNRCKFRISRCFLHSYLPPGRKEVLNKKEHGGLLWMQHWAVKAGGDMVRMQKVARGVN